jgi:hypothetical protein
VSAGVRFTVHSTTLRSKTVNSNAPAGGTPFLRITSQSESSAPDDAESGGQTAHYRTVPTKSWAYSILRRVVQRAGNLLVALVVGIASNAAWDKFKGWAQTEQQAGHDPGPLGHGAILWPSWVGPTALFVAFLAIALTAPPIFASWFEKRFAKLQRPAPLPPTPPPTPTPPQPADRGNAVRGAARSQSPVPAKVTAPAPPATAARGPSKDSVFSVIGDVESFLELRRATDPKNVKGSHEQSISRMTMMGRSQDLYDQITVTLYNRDYHERIRGAHRTAIEHGYLRDASMDALIEGAPKTLNQIGRIINYLSYLETGRSP